MKQIIVTLGICLLLISSFFNTLQADEEKITVKAKVVKQLEIEDLLEDNKKQTQQKLTIRIEEGEYQNEEFEMQYTLSSENELISQVFLKEGDSIIVQLTEEEGEITNIDFQEKISITYIWYIVGAVLLCALLLLGRKEYWISIIACMVTVILGILIIFFSIKQGWNLLGVSIMMSSIITIGLGIFTFGYHKKMLVMLVCVILGITIAGIYTYLLFNSMHFWAANIKIASTFVNLKDFICSGMILFSTGIINAIMILTQYMKDYLNKPYKTKSDNVIEGQRSLKL